MFIREFKATNVANLFAAQGSPISFVRQAGIVGTFLLVAQTAGILTASAQTPPPAYTLPMPPADVQKVTNEVADLDLLKALVPLRLTKDQTTKLIVPLRKASEAGVAARKDDETAVRALAAEVTKARTGALAGTPVGADMENRVVKLLADSEERTTKVRKEGATAVQSVARDILTSEQKDEIERQVGKMLGGKRLIPAKYRANPSQAPKEEVQNLAVGVFIERILLNDRALSLLPLLQTPSSESASSSGTSETAPAAPASLPPPAAKP